VYSRNKKKELQVVSVTENKRILSKKIRKCDRSITTMAYHLLPDLMLDIVSALHYPSNSVTVKRHGKSSCALSIDA
jgi:hypothetical protein